MSCQTFAGLYPGLSMPTSQPFRGLVYRLPNLLYADFPTFLAKLRLNNFVDIPLKFLLTLKNIYSREGNYKNGDYAGNVQTLKKDSLDEHLGGLSERIIKQLSSRDRIRTGKTSEKPLEIKRLILETTWAIAVQRGWLVSLPSYDEQTEKYKFNINAGYFDRKATSRRIQSP
jgi:hypothetical protein